LHSLLVDWFSIVLFKIHQMKAFLLLFCLSTTIILGQTKISLLESTKKISPLSEESIFIGLHAGDVLILNVEELNAKELKEIELIEYPSNSKFLDYKTPRIDSKQITINNTGIYKLRIANSAVSGRICKINLDRIPAENTQNFNTTVYWKTVSDTTFFEEEETYLARKDTSYQLVYEAYPKLGSLNSLEGTKSYQYFEFTLPDNTTSWAFYVGTGTEAKSEYDRANRALASNPDWIALKEPDLSSLPLLALTGNSYFRKISAADNVNYIVLPTNQVSLRNADLEYVYFFKGDVYNDFHQVENKLVKNITAIVKNDNSIDAIYVYFKVAAVVVTPIYAKRMVKKQKVTTSEVPFLK
jgi:hypothetical protein